MCVHSFAMLWFSLNASANLMILKIQVFEDCFSNKVRVNGLKDHWVSSLKHEFFAYLAQILNLNLIMRCFSSWWCDIDSIKFTWLHHQISTKHHTFDWLSIEIDVCCVHCIFISHLTISILIAWTFLNTLEHSSFGIWTKILKTFSINRSTDPAGNTCLTTKTTFKQVIQHKFDDEMWVWVLKLVS